MFSERLRLARKREGLSLRDLASRIDGVVSAQAIGKYERGEMMPGSTAVIALSKALGVSVGYLLSPSDVSLDGVEFRKLASANARERVLGFASNGWKAPREAPFPVGNIEDAEGAASSVRKAWNLGGNPIPDMTELLEERGIKVLKLDFPLSVDGLTCKVRRPGGGRVPVVVCSTGKSVERQRFTLAHELGHMLLDVRGSLNAEKACHRFASAFLVPGEELLAEVGQRRHAFGYGELIEIKRMFGVSAAALVVRLRDLGIVSEGTLRKIFSGVGRSWRTEEPEPLERGEPTRRFHRLCYRALGEDAISLSKAAELLQMPVSEIERTMSGPER